MTFICLFGSCIYGQQKQTLKGDLFFVSLDLYKLFDIEKPKLDSICAFFTHVNTDTLDSNSRRFITEFKRVIKTNQHTKPYVSLKVDTCVIKLFVNDTIYKKLTSYDYNQLIEQHALIEIEAEVTETSYFFHKAYICQRILSIKKKKGQTYNNKDNPF